MTDSRARSARFALARGAPLALALAMAAGLPGCRPPVRGAGWNVLLVTYETTRADHLSAYAYCRATSPHLEALARRGVLFERFYAVSPRTNPSLASLFTSRYPHEHGVRNLLLPLEPDNATLAEILREHGYVTEAVQTHPRLIASSGLAQGFDDYDDRYAEHPLADQAARNAAARLRRLARGARPWFLWVHLMDPHWTYDPPPPWRTAFGPEDLRPRGLYAEIAARRRRMGEIIFRNRMAQDEVQAFVDLYDAEIRFADEALGTLWRTLEELEIAGRTIVIVSADHGESLGEHDYFFEHGDFGFEPEIRIPLVLVAPSGLPAGVRVSATASNIDVAPTVLELLDLPPHPAFRGRSLLPLVRGEESDRLCFGESGKRFHEENTRREIEGPEGKWRWLVHGKHKLMYAPRASGDPAWRLYDLDADPGEAVDLAAERPDLAGRMRQALAAWLREDPGEPRDYHIAPETREVLRSLGYVD